MASVLRAYQLGTTENAMYAEKIIMSLNPETLVISLTGSLKKNMDTILNDLDNCPLHRKSPYGVTNVSQTQLSIARYYGAINFNGFKYIYNPMTDELIREDVLKWKTKNEKQKRKKKNENIQDSLQLT